MSADQIWPASRRLPTSVLDYTIEAEKNSEKKRENDPILVPQQKMQGGEIFEAGTSFTPGKLLIKRHVIERLLKFPDY